MCFSYLNLTSRIPHLPSPSVLQSTCPPVHAPPSPLTPQSTCPPLHTSLSHVTIPVPRLITARHSLPIYTSTPLHVTNGQPVIYMDRVALPFWITQYWTFPSLLTCCYGRVLRWGIRCRKTVRFALFCSL